MDKFQRWKDGMWPMISDATIAKRVANDGAGIASVIAIGIFILTLVTINSNDFTPWSFLDSLVFAVTALAIKYKTSRIAAILGLVFYLLEIVASTPSKINYIVVFFFVLGFISSIRGTFAYHKFIKTRH